MARNYEKFYLVTGSYDDGSGGSIIYTNFFQNEFQAEAFFGANTFLNPVWVYKGNIWMGYNKQVFGTWLNIANGNSVYFPYGPPLDYLESPRSSGLNSESEKEET